MLLSNENDKSLFLKLEFFIFNWLASSSKLNFKKLFNNLTFEVPSKESFKILSENTNVALIPEFKIFIFNFLFLSTKLTFNFLSKTSPLK